MSSLTLLRMLLILLLTTPAISLEKRRERKKHGRYTTKEVVEKSPKENHPCNLTRTAVKISFPDMKDELFVNLIGYKEPNLVHLDRCKGMCGNRGSSVGCVAKKKKAKERQNAIQDTAD